jgi:hypothetical protein
MNMETFTINDLTIYGINDDEIVTIEVSDGFEYGITLKEFLNMEDIKELIHFLQKQLQK